MDSHTFHMAQRVATLVFELLEKYGGSTDPSDGAKLLWMDDRRTESPNPYSGGTKRGLLLEMYYGVPSRLWTPWGCWGFVGSSSGNFDALVEELLKRTDAVMTRPKSTTDWGVFGPIYMLSCIDETPLEEAVPARLEKDYMVYLEEWRNLLSITKGES